ncbi:MAG: OadG family transporter subunit [Planctomycetota bacterium]
MTLTIAQSELGLGLVLTLVGMGVVFASLVVLMVMVHGIGKALEERTRPAPAASPPATPPAKAAREPAAPAAADNELIAVLAAAAAAALGTSPANVRVIRFRRWSGEWSAFGRVNLTQSHRPVSRAARTFRR